MIVLSFVAENRIGIRVQQKAVGHMIVIVIKTVAVDAISVLQYIMDAGNGAINALLDFQNGSVHQVHLGLVYQVFHRIG